MIRRRWGGIRLAVAGALLVALFASGCSGASAPDTQPQGPPSSQVRVGLVEWDFTMSASALVAGPVRLEVTNVGSTAHDLQVFSGETLLGKTEVLRPGANETIELTVPNLPKVTFLCTLPGHESQGMVREVTVVPHGSVDMRGDANQ